MELRTIPPPVVLHQLTLSLSEAACAVQVQGLQGFPTPARECHLPLQVVRNAVEATSSAGRAIEAAGKHASVPRFCSG